VWLAQVAIVGGVGKCVIQAAGAATLDRFAGAAGLDRGAVYQQQIVGVAVAVARELVDQRFDRVRQPLAALVEPRPLRDPRKQVRQAFGGDRHEPRVRRDPHDRLRHAERDDLGIGHDSSGVIGLDEQEIVGGAEHCNEQQVEVGVHRGPLGRRWELGSAVFDLSALCPLRSHGPTQAVELLI
jgi:hypothetical protein